MQNTHRKSRKAMLPLGNGFFSCRGTPSCLCSATLAGTTAKEMISLREAIEDVINEGGPPLAGPYGTGRAEVGSNRSCTKCTRSKK